MHLLACFSLFDNEPQLVNSILDGFLTVRREDLQAAAKKYLRNDKRAIVFRRPPNTSAPSQVGAKEAA
jgi:predicted Zn-dependent peptidase